MLVCFPNEGEKRKGVDLDSWRILEDMGRTRRGETVITVYYILIKRMNTYLS